MDPRNERAAGERGAGELRLPSDGETDRTTDDATIAFSRGRDKYDAYPEQRRAVTWDVFVAGLLADRSVAKGLAYVCAPLHANGDGQGHRCRDDVALRRWLALDCDGSTADSFAALCMRLSEYQGIGWLTASSTRERPRFRAVIGLSREVDRNEGIRLGGEVTRQLVEGLVGVEWDDSTHRGEQPCYLPLHGAETMRWDGEPVDVHDLLIDAAPLGERPGRRERLEHTASTDLVVSRLSEINAVKRVHDDGKISIVCPFESEHTEPGGESSTVYMLPHFNGVSRGAFHCLHGHCKGRSQAEFREAIGVQLNDDLPPLDAYAGEAARVAADDSAGGDHGAPDWRAAVERLAKLSPMDYERVRQAEAVGLRVRTSTLDGEVRKAREATDPSGVASIQGQAVVFDDPEPWPDEVDGAAVLNSASDTLTRHLGQPDGAADAMALWAAHAHCHTAFLHSPRLNITAPEKNCGKTLTLDVLHSLVPKAIRTEGITTAVLFRIVDKYAPTLLVDEYDAFIHDNEELRGALNAGHKRGGMHLRCEGDKNEVRGFRTFAPVALAGIRDLPGTLADRSIIIHMQRLASTERRDPFDSRRTEPEKILCRKLARWTRDHFRALESADPEMPAGVGHRVRDNWRPLFAIADQAGGGWPARVRRAFALLAQPDDAVRSRAEMLLSDFRDMFAEHGDRILSAAAVGYLVEMEERPWPEYSRGKPITARQVAAALRRFEIKPVVLRTGAERARGYVKDHFTNAFARYLPSVEPEEADPIRDTVTTASGRHSSDFTSVTPEEPVTDRDPPEPAPQHGCHGVTDRKGGSEEERERITI